MAPIVRKTWIDDDGSGTTGTPINNAALQGDIYDPVEAAIGTSPLIVTGPVAQVVLTQPSVVKGRVLAINGNNMGLSLNLNWDGSAYDADDVTLPSQIMRTNVINNNFEFANTTATANPRSLVMLAQITPTGAINERGRTVAMGDWITIPYSAGIFTGSGGMTYTVPAGQVATLAYTLIGRTCFFYFNLSGTIGGTASTDLFITVPFNPTINSPGIMRMGTSTGGTPWYVGLGYSLVGQSKVGFQFALTAGALPLGPSWFLQGMLSCQV